MHRSPIPQNPAEKNTFYIDTVRQGMDGLIHPLMDSLFLIIAIRFFSVGDFWKALISAAGFIGYLLSAPLVSFVNTGLHRRSRVLAGLTGLVALCLILAAFSPSAIFFALAATCVGTFVNIRQPFFTDLYRAAYSEDLRARRISVGLRINLVVALLAGFAYGKFLDTQLASWPFLLLFVALVFLLCAFLLALLPGLGEQPEKKQAQKPTISPLKAFKNPMFLYVQAAWMLVGFGNLWTLPLRAVYLTEEGRGLGFSPFLTTMILVVIPAGVRLLVNPLWARLYRRWSFPLFRLTINLFFALGIPLYFFSDSLGWIALASILFGIGFSGSPFIWQLWVTRIATSQEVRSYQSAHAFLAGIRGILAPFLGLWALNGLSFLQIGLISGGMILLSALMMLPLLSAQRRF